MTNKIYADKKLVLVLGNKGESCNTNVYFPVMEGLTGTVTVKRCGDNSPSVVSTSVVDGYIVWTVSSYDVAKAGCGHCEVIYTADGVTEKSITYKTLVHSNGYSPVCW